MYLAKEVVRRKHDPELLVVLSSNHTVFDITKHEHVPAVEVYAKNDPSQTPFKIALDGIQRAHVFRAEIKDFEE